MTHTKQITTRYTAKCQACGMFINVGDTINWTKGIKGVTCAPCPPPVASPAPTVPRQRNAADVIANNAALRTDEASFLHAQCSALRSERDQLALSVAYAANVAATMQAERDAAVARCAELQAMLDDLHRLVVMRGERADDLLAEIATLKALPPTHAEFIAPANVRTDVDDDCPI
jgi:hypothetical protein